MIIPFKEVPETRTGFYYTCSAFRWTFQVDIAGGFIGFVHQHCIKDKWYNSHTRIFGFQKMVKWSWGIDHFWYDGPHCVFSFGPLQFQWWNDKCKKCGAM